LDVIQTNSARDIGFGYALNVHRVWLAFAEKVQKIAKNCTKNKRKQDKKAGFLCLGYS
jgi:hypothetical protein